MIEDVLKQFYRMGVTDIKAVAASCKARIVSKLPSSFLAFVLFCVFGVGSWVAVNGIWAEISILSLTLPECSRLPAVLVVVIQVANVGPIAYTLTKIAIQRSRWSSKQYYLEVSTVFLLVAVGLTSCVCLTVFWDRTTVIGGQKHSSSLFTILFFLALVDCTSSVVFLPFLKHFPSEYIIALYIGEGASGVLPTAIALSQGSVNNSISSCIGFYPGHTQLGLRFSPNIYFLFLAMMTLLCGLAFLLINCLPTTRKLMIPFSKCNEISYETISPEESENILDEDEPGDDDMHTPLTRTPTTDQKRDSDGEVCRVGPTVSRRRSEIQEIKHAFTGTANSAMVDETALSLRDSVVTVLKILWTNKTIYVCLALVNFITNGALAAISSFAFLPYGNEVYHLAVNLGLLATPLMCVVFVFLPHKSPVFTAVLTALACLLSIYILSLALLSPTPPLYSEISGKIIVVSLGVFHHYKPFLVYIPIIHCVWATFKLQIAPKCRCSKH